MTNRLTEWEGQWPQWQTMIWDICWAWFSRAYITFIECQTFLLWAQRPCMYFCFQRNVVVYLCAFYFPCCWQQRADEDKMNLDSEKEKLKPSFPFSFIYFNHVSFWCKMSFAVLLTYFSLLENPSKKVGFLFTKLLLFTVLFYEMMLIH